MFIENFLCPRIFMTAAQCSENSFWSLAATSAVAFSVCWTVAVVKNRLVMGSISHKDTQ